MAADGSGSITKIIPVWTQPGVKLPEPFASSSDLPPPAPLPLTGSEEFIVYINNVPATTSTGDLLNAGVSSWNGRTGAVDLTLLDITAIGGAPIYSPDFQGNPQAPTPAAGDASTSIATTAFVTAAVDGTFQDFLPITGGTLAGPGNLTVNGLMTAASGYFVAAGTPGSNNGLVIQVNNLSRWTVYSDNTNELGANSGSNFAITAYNDAGSPLYSPITIQRSSGLVTMATGLTVSGGLAVTALANFTSTINVPTAPAGTSNTLAASTAFVTNAIGSLAPGGVTSFNGRTGAITLTTGDITGAGGATAAQLAGYLPLAGGTVTGPTNFNVVVTGPTAAPGTNTTQLASTAFVTAAIAAIPAGGVTSFNGRQGAITLTLSDVTSAGGAPLSGPIFTNNPRGPTPAPGDNSTSLATTAFVDAAIAALPPSSAGAIISATPPANPSAGNLWFDSVGLQTYIWYNDPTSSQWVPVINSVAAGGGGGGIPEAPTDGQVYGREGSITAWEPVLPLTGGAISGPLTAPTPTAGDNSTNVATTAFVGGAITTATGAYLPLTGGAITGPVTAPTPAAADNSTNVATTAYARSTFVPLTGGTMSGQLTIGGTAGLRLTKAAGANNNLLIGATSGSNRWQVILGDSVAESGSNAGSNFDINNYTDGGVLIGTAFTIARSTGAATFTSNSGLSISPGAGAWAMLYLNKPASGTGSQIISTTAGLRRWSMELGAGGAESGSNAGSDFTLTSYNDAGSSTGTVFSITRASGNANFTNSVSCGAYLYINPISGNNSNIYISKASGQGGANYIHGQTNGSERWLLAIGDGGSETGGNAGSNFLIYRYNDSGGQIDAPFNINRASGDITVANHLSCTVSPGGYDPGGRPYVTTGYFSSGQWYAGEQLAVAASGGAGLIGYNHSGSNVQWSTSASDRRLKSNLKAAGDAISIVKSLAVYDLDFKPRFTPFDRSMPEAETEHWPFSLIADEVAAIMPHAAIKNTEDDGDHWVALHPTHLIATLWKAVQQLTEKLDTVTAELDAIKAQMGASNATV